MVAMNADRSRYFNRQGQPISLMEWASLFDSKTYQQVAFDKVAGVDISTVWLGADHCFSKSDAPLIFATMIFGGPHDEFQRRYSTEAQALEGHRQIIEALKAGKEPE